jgi:endogenous inhibitor of DNA gyrase (YacG/DUF329 family)
MEENKLQNQNCPLCGKPAEYYERNHLKFKNFKCDKCVEFVISKEAERHPSFNINKEEYSVLAQKAQKGYILKIWTDGNDLCNQYVNCATLLP